MIGDIVEVYVVDKLEKAYRELGIDDTPASILRIVKAFEYRDDDCRAIVGIIVSAGRKSFWPIFIEAYEESDTSSYFVYANGRARVYGRDEKPKWLDDLLEVLYSYPFT